MSTQLGEYLDEMRRRHPRLSMRGMAVEAGIGESLVYGIIKDGRGARPETLKALADKWGTPDDYRELMRLAGHPLPANAGLDAEQRAVAQLYDRADEETKQRVREILRGYAADEPQGPGVDDKWKFLERFTFEALREIVRSLTPQERERLIVEFLEFLRHQEENNERSAGRADS